MYTVLTADCFFGIVLSHTTEYSFENLVSLRDRIQETYNEVIIDISRAAVKEATSYYPSYFSFDGSVVKKKTDTHGRLGFAFVEREFSREVPISILRKIDEFVSGQITCHR